MHFSCFIVLHFLGNECIAFQSLSNKKVISPLFKKDNADLSLGSWLRCPGKCKAFAYSLVSSATASPQSKPHRCLWHSDRTEAAEDEAGAGRWPFGHQWRSQILRTWERKVKLVKGKLLPGIIFWDLHGLIQMTLQSVRFLSWDWKEMPLPLCISFGTQPKK